MHPMRNRGNANEVFSNHFLEACKTYQLRCHGPLRIQWKLYHQQLEVTSTSNKHFKVICRSLVQQKAYDKSMNLHAPWGTQWHIHCKWHHWCYWGTTNRIQKSTKHHDWCLCPQHKWCGPKIHPAFNQDVRYTLAHIRRRRFRSNIKRRTQPDIILQKLTKTGTKYSSHTCYL